MKRTCAVICAFAMALPLVLQAAVIVAPPQAEPAAAAPDPVALRALQKLVAVGKDLNFNLDKDAPHEQFQVECAVHAPPDFPAAPAGDFHPNALSFLVGRDKDKSFFLLYATEFRIPLAYGTNGFMAL